MTFHIKQLSKDWLKSNVQNFVKISSDNIPDEYWNETHFLTDLPKKWEYSCLCTDINGNLVGFLIASEKEHSIHIHKFVVNAAAQGNGIGTMMFNRLLEKVSKPITLKVHTKNKAAISFYEKKGFIASDLKDDMYAMTLAI
jgi:ribosomal protein S18 acetylase RimI-like enzyme